MTTLYQLENVTKSYRGREVLRVPDLVIEAGEIFALIGPSGAGKSTLLRLLGLLEPPTSGKLSYGSLSATGSIPIRVRREVTMMFQHPLLLDRTVEGNVEYGLSVRGEREPERVAEALAEVGLSHLAQARARTLSGGEQQRVALARALVFNPRVLLLDEPTAHLDPRNVAIIEGAISLRRQQRGTTIILATHNLYQASRLAARVAMMLDGQMIEIAAAHDLLENASDARTRAFVEGGMVH